VQKSIFKKMYKHFLKKEISSFYHLPKNKKNLPSLSKKRDEEKGGGKK